jgi:hypothetical protein
MTYRAPDETPRFICIVCYQTASTISGFCPRCSGSPLQPIEGEVLDELRKRASAKAAKADPERRKYIFVVAASIVCALALDGALLGLGVYDVETAPTHGPHTGMGTTLILYPFLMFLGFLIVFAYAAKWLHLFERGARFDAAKAEVAALLAYLGIEVRS